MDATTMFPAQDYSLDDHYRLTHLKYDLAPPVLAKLSRTLPELQMREGVIVCSFQWRNHPECEKLKIFASEWARLHFGGDIINISCDKLIGSDFHLLATMAMAGGRSERMPAAVKLMVWFFVFDNFMDEPAHMGADMGASQEMVDAIMSVFDNPMAVPAHQAGIDVRIIRNGDELEMVEMKGEEYSDYSRAIRVIRESARDWWEEMRRLGMSERQQCRFVSVFTRYLEANTEQVAFRQLRQIPDLEMYKELRLHSIGWYVSSLTLEFALGLDLPDEIIEHPLVSALEVATAFHITFVNDIFSFRKELSDGDLMNLVPLILWHNLASRDRRKPMSARHVEALARQTVAEVLGVVRGLDEECARLVAEIRAAVRSGGVLAKEAAAVEMYVEGVSDWLSGNLRWHRLTKRYKTRTN